MTRDAATAVQVLFCYAREDEALLDKLKAQLAALQRQQLIEVWHDRNISAGTEWAKEIYKYLNTADIILLLVSSDFMSSDYCYSIEMSRAMERHERSEARVIPVLLRPVYWKKALLESFKLCQPMLNLSSVPTGSTKMKPSLM